MLSKIERKLSRFAVPHLTIILIVGQVICYVAAVPGRVRLQPLELIPNAVMAGEYWRLVTFLFMPPDTNALFFFFYIQFFYMMGTALDNFWGTFRYNLYIFLASVMSIAAAWATPDATATSVYIYSSVFLGFAFLYPEYVIYIFFILPVKVKWIALVMWIFVGIGFFTAATWSGRLLVVASVANFLLFFGKDLIHMMRSRRRRMVSRLIELPARDRPFHTCAACGATDKSHPQMEFRYCPSCDGSPAYCMDHIHQHEHRGKTVPKS